MRRSDFDVLLVGGGLQSGLIALALAHAQPRGRVAIVESGPALGGNHTWSFHAGDVAPALKSVVDPLVEFRAPAYDVRFPGFARTVAHPYATFTSARLHAVVSDVLAKPGSALLLGSPAVTVTAHDVTLADGRAITGALVVDARGPEVNASVGRCGYQKFVGLELALTDESAVPTATLMDATVAQTDGFRFVYTLPLGPGRCLIEDTYYSDTPDIDRAVLSERVLHYASARGFTVASVLREEHGVLPLPWAGVGPRPAEGGPLRAGYSGQWFHPATGYSLPVALRLAAHIARNDAVSVFGPALHELAAEHTRQARFCHLLNRLLFLAMEPGERWNALARFYRLPDDTIQRFYALTLTHKDRRRLLLGRPPKGISLRGVIAAMEAR